MRMDELVEKARADTDTVLKELETRLDGLSEAEAGSRLKQFGTNEIAREKRQSALMRLLSNIKNTLVLLLLALGTRSYFTGDQRATVVIFVMVVLGVVLRFYQEQRADNAAEKLQAMVSNTATLVRGGKEAHDVSTFDEVEHHDILKALQKTGWHIEGNHGTAVFLDLNPDTLRARMRKYGILPQ